MCIFNAAPIDENRVQRLRSACCIRRECIDGVNHIVVTVEVEISGGFFVIQTANGLGLYLRIYLQQPFAHHFNLGAPHGIGKGRKLAVDIADRHTIGVDHGYMPYSAAGQRLDAPRAYAAYSEHYYPAVCQTLHALRAKQQFAALKYRICHISV